MAVAFVLTFFVRFQDAGFVNDHFTHLSRARQIVLGEWPIRDFFDPGQFLHYYLSAAVQLMFGHGLFGEALLTVTFVALGAALTFGVGARLSGSVAIAACATLTSVISFPRLYNYPKVFLYVGAIWLAWWYAHGPEPKRIRVLAAYSVLAFHFRYDHGVYIAGLMLVLLALVHADRPRQWATAVARYAAVSGLLLLPFAAYVQWAAGVPEYVAASRASVQAVGGHANDSLAARFSMGGASSATGDQARTGRVNLGSGVTDLLTTENALAWFTSVTVVLPYVVLIVCVWTWARGRVERPEAAAVVATACLCAVISRTLVAQNPGARLADVAPPTAALGAWLTGRWLAGSAGQTPRLKRRLFGSVTLAIIVAVTAWSVAMTARLGIRLQRLGVFEGPGAVWGGLAESYEHLRLRPIDAWAPPGTDGNLRRLGRYVERCTSPDDRLLIAGVFAPEVYYYTERRFAGGQVHFLGGWHESLPEQRLTLERLQRQTIPIALVGEYEASFKRRFSFVADHVRTRFREVGVLGRDNDDRFKVLVDRQLVPSGTDREFGWPCYRAR